MITGGQTRVPGAALSHLVYKTKKNRRRRGCFDPTAEPSERGQPIQAFTGTDSRSRLDRCRDSAG